MVKNIVTPKIARQHKCKECSRVFRPDYSDFDVKCPYCKSDNVRPVWLDTFLDIVKF